MQTIWPFSLYFLLFAGFASVYPFFVLYYQDLGFTGAQIGLLTGITPLITLVCAPLWARFADRTRRHRLVMTSTLLIGAGVLSVFPLLRAYAAVLGLAIGLHVVFAPLLPLADSATMVMLGDRKEMYSRLRLGGTIGYGAAAAVAGVIVHNHGIRFAFWLCAIFFLLALLVSQWLAHGQASPSEAPGKGGFRQLLADPRWFSFLTVAFAGGLALAGYNYFFSYMKEIGSSESLMGLAVTIGSAAEIPVLFFGHRLIRRFRPRGVLRLAMVATALRLLLFAACGRPDHVLVIQLINGFTFPLMLVAGVSYAHEMAPPAMATTAQGLFSAMVSGFGMAAGGFAGGVLLERIGGRGLYLVFGIVVLAIVGFAAVIERRSTPGANVAEGSGVADPAALE
jgi:PPP family 3-phenylpropionic acid transporter